ncbi:MAG: hypothetical protein EBQ89_06540 [Alphaproteobacteria bacterium]|nr:hypothetical protein [Alphaproteobacteria bacterium]
MKINPAVTSIRMTMSDPLRAYFLKCANEICVAYGVKVIGKQETPSLTLQIDNDGVGTIVWCLTVGDLILNVYTQEDSKGTIYFLINFSRPTNHGSLTARVVEKVDGQVSRTEDLDKLITSSNTSETLYHAAMMASVARDLHAQAMTAKTKSYKTLQP